ncbi:hypothetical protein BQ8482_960010 [Mesorhizobium delmotii]|uniref:Uncharacterized protein n=1 Tax=Mesorhizobium delmotii TaxID=1631247 RepID=A0A2P9AY09_9HYPH|nr:hypothetical protein BQ8482_960010 [Mesorhizobium delmotii]
MVLRGIGRLDIGQAATGGIGIVFLAIILDRLGVLGGLPPLSRCLALWPCLLDTRLRKELPGKGATVRPLYDGNAEELFEAYVVK